MTLSIYLPVPNLFRAVLSVEHTCDSWMALFLVFVCLFMAHVCHSRVVHSSVAAFAVASRPSARKGGSEGLQAQTAAVESTDLSSLLEHGVIPISERKFLVNGWRWHTMSVIRDLSRFRAVLSNLRTNFKENHRDFLSRGVSEERLLEMQVKQTMKVMACLKFVIGFNWKALMGVENQLFFPWLQDFLPKDVANMLKDFGTEHDYIKKQWTKLENRCEIYLVELESRKKGDNVGVMSQERGTLLFLEHLAFLYQVDGMLVDLQQAALRVQSLQQGVFVPLVAAYVKTQDQERFNNKVVSSLGLLDSQVHLVSMHDAIAHDMVEKNLWKNQIPKIARSLLPLWRRRLYTPKANCLVGSEP